MRYLLSPQCRASAPWWKFERPLDRVWKRRTCTGSRSLKNAAQGLLECADVHHYYDVFTWPVAGQHGMFIHPCHNVPCINLQSVLVLVGFAELSYHRTNKWSQTWALRLSLHRWQLDWKWTPVWKHKGVLVCRPSGCASSFIEAIEGEKKKLLHVIADVSFFLYPFLSSQVGVIHSFCHKR